MFSGQDGHRLLLNMLLQHTTLLATGHNSSEGLWILNATLMGFLAAQKIIGSFFLLAVNSNKKTSSQDQFWIHLCSKMASAYTLTYPSHASLLENPFFTQMLAGVFFRRLSGVYSRWKEDKVRPVVSLNQAAVLMCPQAEMVRTISTSAAGSLTK